MSPGYWLYNALASAVAPAALTAAAAKGRLKGSWRERLGFAPRPDPGDGPLVWIHAVSVGEMKVAAALTEALLARSPALRLIVSSTTDTGLNAARAELPPSVGTLTFPIDVYGAPGRALDRIRPDLAVVLETELWPNFLKAASARKIRTMMANGRISARSFKGYRKAAFLFKEVLGHLDLMAMIGPDDRDRVVALGADPARVRVAGNAKYDLLLEKVDQSRSGALGAELGLEDRPVLTAGSTRTGEEGPVLEAFIRLKNRFPGLHLILAPRHVGRAAEVAALIRNRGLSYRVWSGRAESGAACPDVTLVDVMGRLFYLYGLSRAAFIGGSLVPLGGQNPYEAAAWGRPVLFGPHMDDFDQPARALLAAGAARTVTGPEDFYREAEIILADPAAADARGEAGRRRLAEHDGASVRLAEMALSLLQGSA